MSIKFCSWMFTVEQQEVRGHKKKKNRLTPMHTSMFFTSILFCIQNPMGYMNQEPQLSSLMKIEARKRVKPGTYSHRFLHYISLRYIIIMQVCSLFLHPEPDGADEPETTTVHLDEYSSGEGLMLAGHC